MSDDLISRKEAIDILENMIFEVGKDLSKSYLLQAARERIIRLNTAFDKEKVIDIIAHANSAISIGDKYKALYWMKKLEEIVEKGEIDYPENRWIPSDCQIKPKNKELCTIILKNNDDPVRIVQYRDGLFYYIRDILWHDCIFEYFENEKVSYWKPLDLPEDVNESIQKEIDEGIQIWDMK